MAEECLVNISEMPRKHYSLILLVAINQLLSLINFVLTAGQNRLTWGQKALIQKESICKLVIHLVKIPHETGY